MSEVSLDSTTIQKQNFLRTEIIEDGLSPQQFAEFLNNEREEGDQLENWSVLSLEEAVGKYKETLKVDVETSSLDDEIQEGKDIDLQNEPEIQVKKEEIAPKQKEKEKKKKSPVIKKKVAKNLPKEKKSKPVKVKKAKNLKKKKTIKKKRKLLKKQITEGSSSDSSSSDESSDSSSSDSDSDSSDSDIEEKKKKTSSKTKKKSPPTKLKKEISKVKVKKPKYSKARNKEKEGIRNELIVKANLFKNSLNEFSAKETCRRQRKDNKLTDSNFRVIVSAPRVIKKGMFKSKYVVFKVETRPYRLEAERRFSDFLWLRKILVREYPSFYIPPIPPKDGRRNFDEFYLNKRMQVLQMFIDSICQHKELRSSKYFWEFLETPTSSEFSGKCTNLEKKTRLYSGFREQVKAKLTGKEKLDLKSFSNLAGEVEAIFSPDVKIFCNSVEELNGALIPAHKVFEDTCKELLINFDQTTTLIHRLAKCCQDIRGYHEKFSNQNNIGKTTTNSELFGAMSRTLNSWASSSKEQISIVENHLLKSVNYTNLELESHDDLIKSRKSADSEFMKIWVSLENKKERLISQGYSPTWNLNCSKYKLEKNDVITHRDLCKSLMLPTETEAMVAVQKVVGYLNNQLVSESTALFGNRAKRYIQSLTEFSKDMIDINGTQNSMFKKFSSEVCGIFAKMPDIVKISDKKPTK